MTTEEVKRVLHDAWKVCTIYGVTGASKDHWKRWCQGYLFALYTKGHISQDTEKELIKYVHRDR